MTTLITWLIILIIAGIAAVLAYGCAPKPPRRSDDLPEPYRSQIPIQRRPNHDDLTHRDGGAT